MRGGVSLAVWMGGACSELVRLRLGSLPHGPETAGAGVYRELLKACGYDQPVDIDVIAGTSAGGLNGVLLGWHLAHGASFGDDVRDMWLRLADLGDLSRRPLFDGNTSLLRGDDYFFPQVRAALEKLRRLSSPDARAQHPLRLLVTATRLRPRTDAVFPGTGPRLGAAESRSFFRFRYQGTEREYQDCNDFLDAERMAYVARTTSSFPGAFEPATVNPCDPGSSDPDAAGVNVHGVSSETRVTPADPDDQRLELIDGGVLDNVPLTWAVRAVAGMPAEQPVNRWLLYLQPDPGNHVENSPHTDSATRLVKSLLQTTRLKGNAESILDDEENLRQLAAAESREQAVLLGIDPALTSAGRTGQVAAKIGTYRIRAGLAELRRLQRLASAPLSVVGLDPLPIPDTELSLRAAFDAYDRSDGGPLTHTAEANPGDLVLPEHADEVHVGRGARSPLVATRSATLLLHVLRQLEATRDARISEEELKDLRHEIYDLRSRCEKAVARRDRLLLETIAHEPWRTPESLLAKVSHHPDAEHVEQRRGDAEPPDGTWKPEPYRDLWDDVVQKAVAVANLLHKSLPEKTRVEPLTAVLRGATGTNAADRALRRLEITTGASRPDPLGASIAPRLVVASAAEASPLEERIYGRQLQAPERIDCKLNGNQVGNFAAFLSARWRQNDWLWGRMDGAQSLVSLITSRDRVCRIDAATLRKIFFTDLPEDPHYRRLLEQEWRNGMYAGDPVRLAGRAITTRLHWDILRHELEHLRKLDNRKLGKDRPPSASGRELRSPENDFADDPEPQLKLLASVGGESVPDLLRRPDLRRTQLQLALVALGAVFPDGWKGKLSFGVSSVTAGPLAILPLLLAVLAPWGMVVSMLALGALTVLLTGQTMSPAQIPSLLGIVMVAVYLAPRFWKWRDPRFFVGALGVASIVTLLVVGRNWKPWILGQSWTNESLAVTFAIAGVAAIAVGAPMVATMAGAVSHALRAHERSFRWLLPVGALALAAAVTLGLTCVFLRLFGPDSVRTDPIGTYPVWVAAALVWALLATGFWGLLGALSVPRAGPAPDRR